MKNTLIKSSLWVLWIALAAVGGAGIVERILTGHRFAGYTSYVPWGMWVASYIYFIGLSAGAFLLSSLVYVFGVHKLERIAKLSLYVATVTLVMALMTIWFDLGHLERFYYVFLRPQFHSMMAWMVWLYTGYFGLLLAELFFALRRDVLRLTTQQIASDDATLRLLGALGIPLAIAFHGGVGALFGTVVAREFWHTPLFPIIFLTGALLSGGALMTVIVAIFWPVRDEAWSDLLVYLGKITLGLVLFDTLLEWAEYSIPMWYGIGWEFDLMKYVLFGPYWYVFWIVHLLFGVVVPVTLLAAKRSAAAIGTAAGLVAVTFFAIRLDLVIPGLMTPELAHLEHAYFDPIKHRLSYPYLPSFFEWQVLMGTIAVGIALFYLGYRFLPLIENGEEREPHGAHRQSLPSNVEEGAA